MVKTIHHVTFGGTDREEYVLAPGEREVHVVLKRMFNSSQYDFDWEDYTVTDTGSVDIEPMVRGDEPPFSVLEAHEYHIVENEKRVNQAGFKVVYPKIWNR